MASKLGIGIWHDVIRHYEEGDLSGKGGGGPELVDALLAPVLEFISLVHTKPCECESMKRHALRVLASLNPNPKEAEGEWTVNKNIPEEDRSPPNPEDADEQNEQGQ